MDWKYWITTAIALYAAVVAWMARKEARETSEKTHYLQERLEIYEHYPIINISIEPDDKKIRITLTNSSSKNMALNAEIMVNIRITAGNGMYRVEKERVKFSTGVIEPNSTIYIDPKEINDLIFDSIPFLNRYPKEQNHFVVRANLECSAPHPKSEKIHETKVAFFLVEGGCLALQPEAHGYI
ncbi:hypothetical protein [Comamonas sp. CMM02]|uniref:hypothetical protein n=1 Tax=Comamonas sp. CMM02 TaxID=2769307 RepID=UPI00178330E0|nr:hypothetical protein [Comamonas sp. CMM02]MBD9402662.1 hypothetical protein [Comamonas sp. CMM02]